VVQILGTYIFKFFIKISRILKSTMTQQKDPRRTKAGAKSLSHFNLVQKDQLQVQPHLFQIDGILQEKKHI
jgi:hypothetical protein